MKEANAIAEYNIQKSDIVPDIKDNPEAYDKMSIVIITLNHIKNTACHEENIADGWKISAERLPRHTYVIFLMTNKTKFSIKT